MRLGLGLGFSKRGGLWLPGGVAFPTNIISSTTINFLQVSDLGVTVATGVTSWDDQTGNGRHWTQPGAGGLQPARNTGGPGGKPYITFDEVDDFLQSAYVPAGTGFLWCCVRRNTATVNAILINASNVGGVNFTLRQTGAANLQMRNTLVGNSAACATGTWFRVWANFLGTTSDELKVGSAAAVTGTSAGNTGGVGGMYMGAVGPGSANFCGFDIVAVMHCAAKPNAGELTALDAWVTSYWGGAIQV